MYAIVKDGQIVKTGSSIRGLFPNTSFPVTGVSDEFRQANGVMDVVSGEQKDQRYYWVTPGEIALVNGVPTQTFVNTPKALEDKEEVDAQGNPLFVQVFDPAANEGKGAMVDSTERLVTKGLKSVHIAQVKTTAGSMLAPTDWMVIRKAERNVDIPADVVTKRAAIVAECGRLEAAIAAATTVDGLAQVMASQNWG
jgi:hypothetical protein